VNVGLFCSSCVARWLLGFILRQLPTICLMVPLLATVVAVALESFSFSAVYTTSKRFANRPKISRILFEICRPIEHLYEMSISGKPPM